MRHSLTDFYVEEHVFSWNGGGSLCWEGREKCGQSGASIFFVSRMIFSVDIVVVFYAAYTVARREDARLPRSKGVLGIAAGVSLRT